MRTAAFLIASVVLALPVGAQTVPSEADQIAAAVLPMPASLRAGAGVMG